MNPERKVDIRKKELECFLPDTRGTWSRWGKGNLKIGPNVYTYSQLPGRAALHGGTCPGSSPECLSICYAFRIRETPLVWQIYQDNTKFGADLPSLPPDAQIVRIHISGDFNTIDYIQAWEALIRQHPKVRFWAYTRSWRVSFLLPHLEQLRALPNIQLFASMDTSILELPPPEWRKAWLGNDIRRLDYKSLECPEETGKQPHCEACKYCFIGRRNDVTFSLH